MSADSQTNEDAHITVTRRRPQDVGIREVYVSLDGRDIGFLRHGDALSQAVDAGTHRLRVHNTLFSRSEDFSVGPGEHVRFATANVAGGGAFALLLLTGAGILRVALDREV